MFLLLFAYSCNDRASFETNELSSLTAKKPVAGNYNIISWISDNGYTLNFTIDQSKTQGVSHILLQGLHCDGSWLDNNTVVSSSVPVTYTTGKGTGCAFNNDYAFIKFDNLDIYEGSGSFTISITFEEKVADANILIKSARNCFPFDLEFTANCEEPEDETHDETAFAYGGDDAHCFLNNGFNRWGWSNGTYSPGEYTLKLYAGAGQCDLDKGTYVGDLSFTYRTDGTATVIYSVNAPYTLDETHLYIGAQMFPINKNNKNTVAPGQYPYIKKGDTYEISGLTGEPVYLIAHAVVGGFLQD